MGDRQVASRFWAPSKGRLGATRPWAHPHTASVSGRASRPIKASKA